MDKNNNNKKATHTLFEKTGSIFYLIVSKYIFEHLKI